MRLFAQALSGHFGRNPLHVLVAIIVVFCFAYLLAQYVIEGDLVALEWFALAVIAAVSAIAMLDNWRTGTFVFIAWLLFEDLARKYLGNNMLIYFGKDVLVALIYLSFFVAYLRKQVRVFRPPFRLPLLLFVWFGILQTFNPASTSFFFGLLGIKLYFYYIPLFFIGYDLLRTEEGLQRFFRFLMILICIVSSLGIVQAILGHTFLNPAVIQEDIRELSTNYRISPFSGLVVYRPTSVFVSAGRFAFFLVPAWLLAFGFSGYLLLRNRRYRLLTFLALACTSAAIALCASRGTLLWTLGSTIIIFPAYLWGCPWQKGQIVRILRAFARATLSVVAAILLTSLLYPDALKGRLAFYWETIDPRSANSELIQRSHTYPLQNFMYAFDYPRWPYGYGIGTASLGVQYVSRILHAQRMGIGVESGFGTLVVELGIVGLFLYLIFAASILISAWTTVRHLKGTQWFPIGFVIFWYAFLFLFPYVWGGLDAFQDFILNSLFWVCLGILFRLPTLQLQPSARGQLQEVRAV